VRKIASFLVVLFIILVSFAHAFFVLLKPKLNYTLNESTNSDDPNNPWSLTDSYNQILEDGTISSKPSFVRAPNTNTNMFTDYRTALLSMYLYLTGMACYLFIFESLNI